jgi:2-polyprenyl-3-methyl-5-hydroxy-6-metoxy-1,4-benzoquinol methylase
MLRTMADALPPDARFWNRFARRYARMKVPDEASYRHKLDRTRAYLTPQARVFEFGCGTGTTALHHAPHVAHIRGVDFAPEMIAIAREKATAQGAANAEFAVGTVEDEPGAGLWDMVMAHSVLHLVPDRDGAIAKAHALLKPGGHFVSSTICLSDGLWFMRPLIPLMRLAGFAPTRVAFFTADDLRAAITRAGFEIVEDWRPGTRRALFLVARKPA